MKGEFYATPPFSKNLRSSAFKFRLSEKEHKILNMLMSGLTAKEIGERINLSKRTVEYYSKKLKERFDAENVVELVSRAKDEYYK
ncbi:MAG: helix-turn-helix transcriptional regulator [Leptospiraceae bacterium]|nr:helix-turn-helix transcriptional regulator [Leptospiraceae bacterium]